MRVYLDDTCNLRQICDIDINADEIGHFIDTDLSIIIDILSHEYSIYESLYYDKNMKVARLSIPDGYYT